MGQPEYHDFLNQFYKRIGATDVQRSTGERLFTPDKAAGAFDLYVDGSLVDRFGAARHFHEKVMMHQWMSRYFTVTVDLPAHPYHGRRGEFWESLAHWHVCAYKNAKSDGLAAVVVCNFQALQDFVSLHADLMAPDEKWVETTNTRRFVRVPISVLLHHKKAANVIVTYAFDGEAEQVYQNKRAALRQAYDSGENAVNWSDTQVHTYWA